MVGKVQEDILFFIEDNSGKVLTKELIKHLSKKYYKNKIYASLKRLRNRGFLRKEGKNYILIKKSDGSIYQDDKSIEQSESELLDYLLDKAGDHLTKDADISEKETLHTLSVIQLGDKKERIKLYLSLLQNSTLDEKYLEAIRNLMQISEEEDTVIKEQLKEKQNNLNNK